MSLGGGGGFSGVRGTVTGGGDMSSSALTRRSRPQTAHAVGGARPSRGARSSPPKAVNRPVVATAGIIQVVGRKEVAVPKYGGRGEGGGREEEDMDEGDSREDSFTADRILEIANSGGEGMGRFVDRHYGPPSPGEEGAQPPPVGGGELATKGGKPPLK